MPRRNAPVRRWRHAIRALDPESRVWLRELDELKPTFFSAGFGMCVDRFGTPWMIVAPDPNRPF